MYVPEAFRIADREIVRGFIATYGFAVVMSQSPEGPFATHVPLLLERAGDQSRARGAHVRCSEHEGRLTL